MMDLREIKEWINRIPEEFLDFKVINAEYGKYEDKDYYRYDKPVSILSVSIETKEILFLNESDVNPEDIEKDLVGEHD